MAPKQHDPLAGRTDAPDYVPNADIRKPEPSDKARDGIFGAFLIALVPVLILAGGFYIWSGVLGENGDDGAMVQTPAHMQPEAVAN